MPPDGRRVLNNQGTDDYVLTFKYILTELPKLCDERGNIDPTKLDYLMPWSDSLPDECRKPRHS